MGEPVLALWTAAQAVAWIVLRDTQLAQSVLGLYTPEAGHQSGDRLPDGHVGIMDVPGAAGVTRLQLDANVVARHLAADPKSKASIEALRDLLAALSDGRLEARAKIPGSPDVVPIPSSEWHQMHKDEDSGWEKTLGAVEKSGDGNPASASEHRLHVWFFSDDVMRLWPRDIGLAELHERHAEAQLRPSLKEPQQPERPGFIWAHRALRLIAFGGADTARPKRMSWLQALGLIEPASQRLCDALASAPDGTATGQPGQWHSRAVGTSEHMEIPSSWFRSPRTGINLRAWAFIMERSPEDHTAAMMSPEMNEWAEVLLPLNFVQQLRPPRTLEAAITWMRANGRKIQKSDVLECWEQTGISRAVARQAFEIAFGPPRQGRPRKE